MATHILPHADINLTSAGVRVPPPDCKEFYPIIRRRTSEPPLCKRRCRASRGGGVVPDKNYLFFCSANPTLLQSLRRSRASSLYTREPFCLCEHCGLTCGASWAPPPTGLCEHCGYVPAHRRGDHWSPARLPPTLTLCVNRSWRQRRLRERARLWRLCKVGKFIRLSHPRFGGWYPKHKLTFQLRALPLPRAARHPPPGGGLTFAPLIEIRFLRGGRI